MPHQRITTKLFHSYLVNSRGSRVDKSKITSFENQKASDLRLFSADIEDPRRTNMEVACSISNDDSFVIEAFKIEAKFSHSSLAPDFIRSTRFNVSVGDKSMFILEANILSDPEMVKGYSLPGGVTATEEGLNTHLTAIQPIGKHIHIPPRQSFDVLMSTSNKVAEELKKYESGDIKGFVEIRFSIIGTRLVKIGDNQETPEEKTETENSTYYPCEEGMKMTTPYRGHGEPLEEESFINQFSKNLMCHLKILTHKGQRWSAEIVKQALQNTMGAFPTYMDDHGFFTIEPEDTTTEDPEKEIFEAEKEFFKDQKPWGPDDYLKKPKG